MPKDERREQVLDAALGVIAADGYSATSIDAIAKRAGLSRPVVYGVFDGLGPLLSALLDRQEKRALDQLLAAFPSVFDAADPLGFVDATVRRMVGVVTSDPDTWRLVLAPADSTPAVVRERVDSDRERVRERMRDMLAAGLAPRGSSADLEVASHALIGIAEHFGRILIDQPGRLDADRIAQTVTSMLSGLATSGASA